MQASPPADKSGVIPQPRGPRGLALMERLSGPGSDRSGGQIALSTWAGRRVQTATCPRPMQSQPEFCGPGRGRGDTFGQSGRLEAAVPAGLRTGAGLPRASSSDPLVLAEGRSRGGSRGRPSTRPRSHEVGGRRSRGPRSTGVGRFPQMASWGQRRPSRTVAVARRPGERTRPRPAHPDRPGTGGIQAGGFVCSRPVHAGGCSGLFTHLWSPAGFGSRGTG